VAARLLAFRMQLLQLVDGLQAYLLNHVVERALARWRATPVVQALYAHDAPAAGDTDGTLSALVAAHEALVNDVWRGCMLQLSVGFSTTQRLDPMAQLTIGGSCLSCELLAVDLAIDCDNGRFAQSGDRAARVGDALGVYGRGGPRAGVDASGGEPGGPPARVGDSAPVCGRHCRHHGRPRYAR